MSIYSRKPSFVSWKKKSAALGVFCQMHPVLLIWDRCWDNPRAYCLKGRIYVKHIKNVTASSAAGEMSLTIIMEDELASFILIFKEQGPLEAWKSNIQALVNLFQSQNGVVWEAPPPLDIEEFGGSAKAMRMLSGSMQTTVSTVDSLLSPTHSTMSSSTSQYSGLIGQRHYSSNKLAPLGEDEELSAYESSTNLVTPHSSSGPSNSLSPLPHPALDLILVISLPPPTALPSTAQLKSLCNQSHSWLPCCFIGTEGSSKSGCLWSRCWGKSEEMSVLECY